MERICCLACAALIIAGCQDGAGVECEDDADCPAGRYCTASTCAFDCTFDRDCLPGYRCSQRGRCERGCSQTNGGLEACDAVDNDCDGLTDEDFPEKGAACSNGGCAHGTWVCAPGGDGLACDGPTPAADDSICDGLDEDCDGLTDEDAVERACPLTRGVCAGAMQTCLGAAGWSACDYGPGYTPDADGCDGRDSDCDGNTDEDGPMLLVPETGAQALDGLDNNCNGLVDEPGGVMVPIPGHPIWIDAYEVTVFANADCTGARYGEAGPDYPPEWPASGPAGVTLYACSLPGLIPSGHLSWYQAQRACAAQGKRLCSSSEHGSACNAGLSTWYPYGQEFVPFACNDALYGPGHVLPTGEQSGCTAGNGTFDMCGNLAEWLSNWDDARPGTAFVGGYGFACVICGAGLNCIPCNPDDQAQVDRLLAISDCNLQQQNPFESFPRDGQRDFIGTRCCLDGP